MKDVIVIGAGFWGSAVARKLKKAGLSYAVVDDGNMASGTRNSGAYTCLRWFDSDTITKHLPLHWTKNKVRKWVRWLEKNDYLEPVGQWTYNKARDTWKRTDDCYLMRDVSAFSNRTKAIPGKAVAIGMHKDFCIVSLENNSLYGRHVVVAAGIWTDSILQKSNLPLSGVQALGGRALILKPQKKHIFQNDKYDIDEWKNEVISINVRPFKNFDLLPNSKNWWYFGATTEREESDKAYDEMVRAGIDLVGETQVTKTLTGFRPIMPEGVKRINDKVIVATGGARIGLALAGSAADDVIKLIKESW